MPVKFLRRPEVLAYTGKSVTTLYTHIRAGLFTPGVPIGGDSVAWPETEVTAINAARLASKTDDEVRELVRQLIEARARPWQQLSLFPELEAECETGASP